MFQFDPGYQLEKLQTIIAQDVFEFFYLKSKITRQTDKVKSFFDLRTEDAPRITDQNFLIFQFFSLFIILRLRFLVNYVFEPLFISNDRICVP